MGSLRSQLVDAGMKSANAVHRLIRSVSGGRLGDTVMGMPAVELEVTGRTSGRPRRVMLTAPVHDATRTVLVASKGGDDRHPEWYRNLEVNPDVTVTIGGVTTPMRARTASTEEKADLWPTILAAYKGYGDYQRRTERDIPVVICEPRPS